VKLFVCSDIHGNVRALDAVLAVYRENSPCAFLCLGDCVGYGPHPDACLERIFGLPRARYIMGNHEWALLHRRERRRLNTFAAEALAWSEPLVIGRFDRAIEERFVMAYESRRYLAAHGSPLHPEEWPYIFSHIDADEVFFKRDFNLCFVGHTHIPTLFTFSEGERTFAEGEPYKLGANDRYIVNPGSVGQPRDLDSRASCCIFDPKEGTIELYRCEYDVEAEVEDFRRAGLPRFIGERLLHGT